MTGPYGTGLPEEAKAPAELVLQLPKQRCVMEVFSSSPCVFPAGFAEQKMFRKMCVFLCSASCSLSGNGLSERSEV